PTTLPDRADSYTNDAGVLYVRIVPGDSSTAFTLFDATRIAQTARDGNAFDFHGGQTFTAGAVLEILRHPAAPQIVTSNGVEMARRDTLPALEAASDGWFWESALGGTLWVKCPTGICASTCNEGAAHTSRRRRATSFAIIPALMTRVIALVGPTGIGKTEL